MILVYKLNTFYFNFRQLYWKFFIKMIHIPTFCLEMFYITLLLSNNTRYFNHWAIAKYNYNYTLENSNIQIFVEHFLPIQ